MFQFEQNNIIENMIAAKCFIEPNKNLFRIRI